MVYRPLLQIDFDGVLHSYDRGWQDGSVYGNIYAEGIVKAWDRGYAVAVASSRDVHQVKEALLRDPSMEDILIIEDPQCERIFWDGGESGRDLLVTNRMLAAVARIDDRQVEHQYGWSWDHTLDAVDYLVKIKGRI